MSMFRAKKLDLGCYVNIGIIRDHSKRKAFAAAEPERCVFFLSLSFSATFSLSFPEENLPACLSASLPVPTRRMPSLYPAHQIERSQKGEGEGERETRYIYGKRRDVLIDIWSGQTSSPLHYPQHDSPPTNASHGPAPTRADARLYATDTDQE